VSREISGRREAASWVHLPPEIPNVSHPFAIVVRSPATRGRRWRKVSVPEKIAAEKVAYDAAVQVLNPSLRPQDAPSSDIETYGNVEGRALKLYFMQAGPAKVALTALGMRARFVHGDAVIADSEVRDRCVHWWRYGIVQL
jgi:hypothetical protein